MGKASLSFRDKAWASSAVNTEFDAWDGLPSSCLSANQYKAQGPRMTIVSDVQTTAIAMRRAHFIAVLVSASLACAARPRGFRYHIGEALDYCMVSKRCWREPWSTKISLCDPDYVKTYTDQKSLESYSNTPPTHPRLDTWSEVWEPRSLRDFCACASVGGKRRASREKERTSDA